MRLLVINPNTSAATTERLARHLPSALPMGTQLTCITASFGATYIACEASYAVAGHALLDAWAAHLHTTPQAEHPDRVLIGCFGDPGLHALRESAACPITGLAEASFIEAAALGSFAIVTGGARWAPMLQRIALSLGFAASLKHIETVRETGAELLADPDHAIRVLTDACQRAAAHNVQSIILGGAGLAGYAARVQPAIAVTVIDSVLAGARVVTGGALPEPTLQATKAPQAPQAPQAPHFEAQWVGLSNAMIQLSHRSPL
jgi:allantoin racemase